MSSHTKACCYACRASCRRNAGPERRKDGGSPASSLPTSLSRLFPALRGGEGIHRRQQVRTKRRRDIARRSSTRCPCRGCRSGREREQRHQWVAGGRTPPLAEPTVAVQQTAPVTHACSKLDRGEC